MTAIRETIIAAFFTRLQTVSGVIVSRRMPGAEPNEFPALDLDDRGQVKIAQDATHATFAMTLAVEGRVQGNGGEAAHQALNALYAAMVTTMLADTDLGLPGTVEEFTEQDTSVEPSALSQTATLAFTTIFDIQFINRSNNPSLT